MYIFDLTCSGSCCDLGWFSLP